MPRRPWRPPTGGATLPRRRHEPRRPDEARRRDAGALVDVTRLPHDAIEELPGGGLRIGAAVRNSDLAVHPLVRERYPVLSQSLLAGASGQLRNLATVGGNLLQRTRCSYFQDVTKPCNKREPGSGCPAREGEHRNLAILGHSEHCVATHPVRHGRRARRARRHRPRPGHAPATRTLPMPGFHRLPGDEPQRDTEARPRRPDHRRRARAGSRAARSAYRKVRERASFSFALVSVAAALDVRDGVVEDCAIALGGVAHVPWRASEAEAALRGRPATQEASQPPPTPSSAPRGAAARQRLQGPAGAQRASSRTLTELSAMSRRDRHRASARPLEPRRGPREGHGPGAATPTSTRSRASPTPRPSPSTIAAGGIRNIDPRQRSRPRRPRRHLARERAAAGRGRRRRAAVLQSPTVAYRGQIVAAVVAESLEAAREAAAAVRVEYAPEEHDVELRPGHPRLYAPDKVNPSYPTDVAQGDLDAGLRAAEVVVARDLRDPADPQQPDGAARDASRSGTAATSRSTTRSRAPAAHGARSRRCSSWSPSGCGSSPSTSAAASARRARRGRTRCSRRSPRGIVERPVKVALTRQQIFSMTGYRTPTIQRVRLGADARRAAAGDRPRRVRAELDRERVRRADRHRHAHMYAAPDRRTTHRLVALDVPTPSWMRAPGECPGMFALESAMDELAIACGIDPIELRIANEPPERPGEGLPFSSRNLVACLREGAERFGWEARDPPPARAATAAGSSARASRRRPTRRAARPRRRRRGSTPTAASRSRSPPRTSAPARAPC